MGRCFVRPRSPLNAVLTFIPVLTFIVLLMAASAPARAQNDYPNRPIRLIVGFAAGGGVLAPG